MLEVGKKAPAFNLADSNGRNVSLRDFRGKKVILYFYPKDMTSGCSQEACNFRDAFPDFSKLNAVIIGVNADSASIHKKFIEKYSLPFILLSDESKKILNRYKVWKEKSMYGKKYMGIERTTFVIDEEEKILHIFSKVKVSGHVEEVLKVIKG
ncbi:MAG: bacterioferritin comigratory protein [Ignavibacteria bacterium]|nr:MAG: bacterioferritin comigratory protein [Ignavibacteria bacterium]KAF0161299.1 MAG: bacterioferritin comigratory protein [Ignavibacteria bacterium]